MRRGAVGHGDLENLVFSSYFSTAFRKGLGAEGMARGLRKTERGG